MEKDIDFDVLNSYSIDGFSRGLTLAEEEAIAEKLVQEVTRKSKQIEELTKQTDKLPDYLEEFRKEYENAGKKKKFDKIPIISQLSPRSKTKLSILPPPTEYEKEQIRKIEEFSKKIDSRNIYKTLNKTTLLPDSIELHDEQLTGKFIPKDASSAVDLSSSRYFESIQQEIKRKSEQKAKVTKLFEPYSDTPNPSSTNKKKPKNHPKVDQQLPILAAQSLPELTDYLRKKEVPLLSRTAAPSTTNKIASAGGNVIGNGLNNTTGAMKGPPGAGDSFSLGTREATPSSSEKPRTSSRTAFIAPENSTLLTKIQQRFSGLPSGRVERINTGSEKKEKPSLLKEYSPILQETAVHTRHVLGKLSDYQLKVGNVKEKKRNEIVNQKEYLNDFSVRVLEETGLDINKTYNRLRKHEESLRKLLYFCYLSRLFSGFKHFFNQCKRKQQARMRRATVRITKALQLGIQIKLQREKERLFLLQTEEEKRRIIEEKQKLLKYGTIIFRILFRRAKLKKIRNRLKRRLAATLIQKMYRGALGRRTAKRLWEIYVYYSSFAIKIQCAYRQRLARRKVILMRKLKKVEEWLKNEKDRKTEFLFFLRLNGAECYIAKNFRTYLIRKKMKNLLYWNKYAKAIFLQRVYRSYRVRKNFRKLVVFYRIRVKLEKNSAITIQRHIRGFLARKKMWTIAHDKLMDKKRKQARKQTILMRRKLINLRRSYRGFKRKWTPFFYLIEHKKAIVIQRHWRGYWGRWRAFVVRVRRIIENINKKEKLYFKATQKIQRIWRAYSTRKRLLNQKMQRLVIMIQCFWRFISARRKVKKLLDFNKKASKLTKYLFRIHKKRQFKKRYLEKLALEKPCLIIQKYFRMWKSKKLVREIRHSQRILTEKNGILALKVNQLLASIQLKILSDTLTKQINQNTATYSASKTSCFCNGPMQAIFVLAACSRGRVESEALLTNKVDPASFSKFLLKVDVLLPHGNLEKQEGNDRENSRKGGRKSILGQNLSLLKEIDSGRWSLPINCTKLKTNEADLLFNKSRTDATFGNLLNYLEFIESLKLVSEAHFLPKERKNSVVRPTNVLKPDQTLEIPPIVQSKGEKPKDEETQEIKITVKYESKQKYQNKPWERSAAFRKARVDFFDLIYFLDTQHLEEARGKGLNPDFRLLLVIKILLGLRNERWMKEILDWIEKESVARVNQYAVRVQCLARRRFASIAREKMKIYQQKQAEIKKLMRSASLIQTMIRIFLDRVRVARAAQRVIIQYKPFLDRCYWFNPKTRVKTWVKPKVLRGFDCYSIALPEKGLENVVYCVYCSGEAEVNCLNCEDSMCQICFDSMHCKGERKFHSYEKIPKCSYCKFQVATKCCLTCILKKPKIGHIQEFMHESTRGSYCDCCFSYEHDMVQREIKEKMTVKRGIKELLNNSKESYLIEHYIHKRLVTNHKYEHLIQTCEECMWRGATWRCEQCSQVYCSHCLLGLHSIGGPFSKHRAELLPYYTPEMHKSFQNDINEQHLQRKTEKLNILELKRKEDIEYISAVTLQSWYRMILGARVGHKIMKRQRKLQRIAYTLRKRETKEIRKKWAYFIADIFGRAPPLRSDTREESSLRGIHVFRRQAARKFVLKNLQDWGHYKVSRTVPRKGVPKRGFDVGTTHELAEQAKLGGYRLPGRVLVKEGESQFTTTCDLRKFLHHGEWVRMGKFFFGVVSVREDTIKLSRLWRQKVVKPKYVKVFNSFGKLIDVEDEEGEVIYRVPIYKNEPQRFRFWLKYKKYDWLVHNPVSQLSLIIYKFYCLRMLRFSLYMLKMNRKKKEQEEAEAWKLTAKRYADRARWAGSHMDTGAALVDLSKVHRDDSDSESGSEGEEEGENEESEEDEGDVFAKAGKRKKTQGWMAKVSAKSKASDGKGEYAVALTTENEEVEEEKEGEISPRSGKRKKPLATLFSKEKKGSASVAAGLPTSTENEKLVTTDSRPTTAGEGTPSEKENGSSRRPTTSQGNMPKIAEKTFKRKKRRVRKTGREAGETWYASADENARRKEREDRMTQQELAFEAGEWKECVDVITENIYFQNIHTGELMASVPRAVAAARQIAFENSKNKKNFDEAQKRIQQFELVTRNRLLISGHRKKF